MTFIESLTQAAIKLEHGEHDPVPSFRWIHGTVQISLKAQEYGPHLSWFKLVEILQGMASVSSVVGCWSHRIDVVEDRLGQIARVFFEKR